MAEEVKDPVARLHGRLREVEAEAAALREALIDTKRIHSQMVHHEGCDVADCADCAYAWEPCEEHPDAACDCCLNATRVEAALASDAGKKLLEELQRLRLQRDRLVQHFVSCGDCYDCAIECGELKHEDLTPEPEEER